MAHLGLHSINSVKNFWLFRIKCIAEGDCIFDDWEIQFFYFQMRKWSFLFIYYLVAQAVSLMFLYVF